MPSMAKDNPKQRNLLLLKVIYTPHVDFGWLPAMDLSGNFHAPARWQRRCGRQGWGHEHGYDLPGPRYLHFRFDIYTSGGWCPDTGRCRRSRVYCDCLAHNYCSGTPGGPSTACASPTTCRTRPRTLFSERALVNQTTTCPSGRIPTTKVGESLNFRPSEMRV